MIFDRAEIIEILEKLGYEIIRDEPVASSSRKSLYLNKVVNYYVLIDGEHVEVEKAFKMELRKRIFNL